MRSSSVFFARSGFLFFSLLLLLAFAGCAGKRKGNVSGTVATDSVSADAREKQALKAIEKTEEDEEWAPLIQRETNSIFFKNKKEKPGGLDAFAADRVQELELALLQSEVKAVRYYLENREYFDRFEDAGGGFRVTANAKRLVPYLKLRPVRQKLFRMDLQRVKEMVKNPCFSAAEDCGEFASDGEENTSLLEDWIRKYPEGEFRDEQQKVLKGYLLALEKAKKRVSLLRSTRTPSGKQAIALIESHIRGVKTLLDR